MVVPTELGGASTDGIGESFVELCQAEALCFLLLLFVAGFLLELGPFFWAERVRRCEVVRHGDRRLGGGRWGGFVGCLEV